MEEPLLGSGKASLLSIVPEEHDSPSLHHATVLSLLPTSPSKIKDMLIFGPHESNAQSQFVWLDYGPLSAQQSALVGTESLTTTDDEHETVCSCADNLQDVDDNNQKAAIAVKYFDDSFLDNRDVSSHRTQQHTLFPSLTRLDLLRAAAAGLASSGFQALPSAKVEREAADDGVDGFTDCQVSTKKSLHRSRTAPALAGLSELLKAKTGTTSSPSSTSSFSVVSHAFLGLMVYLAIGVSIYSWKDAEFSGSTTHGFIDALYFCIVTMCTIGYGDIAPTTPSAKLFSCIFVLVGFGFIDVLLSGMVSYMLDRQEAILLSAVSAGSHEIAKNYLVDVNKGRLRIRSKVTLAFGVVILCIGAGTLVLYCVEDLGWLDAFYLSCMSVTTVGYGDHAFKTLWGRLFASAWLLVSTLAVARSFLYLAEWRIDKRHRSIAKLVLEKELTLGDLLAADLDNDGCVSKSDFVVYKLKEMGIIEEKHILEILRQFSRLDTQNSGKLTLSCLINLRETSVPFKPP